MRITENENGFSPSERQYLLYRFLLEHTIVILRMKNDPLEAFSESSVKKGQKI